MITWWLEYVITSVGAASADDDEDDDKQDRYLRIPEIYINTPNSRQW